MSMNIRSAAAIAIRRMSAEVDALEEPSVSECNYFLTMLQSKFRSLEDSHTELVSRAVNEDELATHIDFWTQIELVYRRAFLRLKDHKAKARWFEGPIVAPITAATKFSGQFTIQIPKFVGENESEFGYTLRGASGYEEALSGSLGYDQPQRLVVRKWMPKETRANICQVNDVVRIKLRFIRREDQYPILYSIILKKLPAASECHCPHILKTLPRVTAKLEKVKTVGIDDQGGTVIANGGHHGLLCTIKPTDGALEEVTAATGVAPDTTGGIPEEIAASSNEKAPSITVRSGGTVILATASVILRAEKGTHPGRLLCDPGSQISCITESMAKRIELQFQSPKVIIEGIGAAETGVTGWGIVRVCPYFGGREIEMEVHVLDNITTELPTVSVSAECCLHLRDLQLADPHFRKPAPIDLLLGADYYGQILEDGIICGGHNKPGAMNTRWGWMVFGPAATEEMEGAEGVSRISSLARPHAILGSAGRLYVRKVGDPSQTVSTSTG